MSSKWKEERSKMPNSRLKVLLAQLLRGENRANITPEEALAIADTPFNRAELAGFPDDPEQVLLQPGQYTPLAPPAGAEGALRENAESTAAFGPGDPLWAEYEAYVAQATHPERIRTPYTHYFSGKPPKWAGSLEGLTQIGSHTFGREKRKKKREKK
jgi:spore germination cell wall hydrolase CwlJ-like protein